MLKEVSVVQEVTVEVTREVTVEMTEPKSMMDRMTLQPVYLIEDEFGDPIEDAEVMLMRDMGYNQGGSRNGGSEILSQSYHSHGR